MKRYDSQVRWRPAGLSNTVGLETATRCMLGSEDIAIWRGKDGQLRAWENRCPHRGMRLSFGIVRDNRLICLYHGWNYDGTGSCAAIPAHSDLEPPKTIKAKTYQVREIANMIWIAPDHMIDDPPDIPGDWPPCRSLNMRGPLSLDGLEAASLITITQRISDDAAIASLADTSAPVLIAVQSMDEDVMLHVCTPEALREPVSLSLIRLRTKLEKALTTAA